MHRVRLRARQLRLERQLREGREISLSEVSRATGIHRNVLTRIERGETSAIDFENLVKLCDYYGVSAGELVDYQPERATAPA